MSQKANTQLILPEPSEELISSEPWSIETYADGLMDELFAEIDLILDGSDSLPSQTALHGSRLKSGDPPTALSEEYIDHVQTVTVPQIVVPETQLRPIQKVPKTRNNPLSTVVVGTPAVSTTSKPPQKSQRKKGILLWVGVTIGLAAASVFWVLNSGLLNRLVSKSLQQSLLQPQETQPQLPTKAQIEADLVNYMLGALTIIDKQEAKSNLRSAKPVYTAAVPANQTALAYITPKPIGKLPAPIAANNIPPAASSHSTTVVERIYIPVYQAPPPMRYAPPPIAGIKTPSVAKVPKRTLANASKPSKGAPVKTDSQKRVPIVAQASKPSKGAPVKTAVNNAQKAAKPATVHSIAVPPELKPVAVAKPVAVRQAAQPVPVLPVMPSDAAPPKLATATTPASSAAPSPAPEKQEVASGVTTPDVTAVAHTLEGLLELGNKSAALFKINGVTRQIQVGEAIGSSGWTLVEVANGEAIIRRNGEVRSIYAGQTF